MTAPAATPDGPVGFVGLGSIGKPMAKRLLAWPDGLHVYDVAPEPVAELVAAGAKAGINGLTQQLAHELGGMGIRVNAVAPGPTDTEATRKQAGDAAKELVKSMAIKRMGQPGDLVGACLFLLSDEAAWVTGQVVNVDGGQVFR